MGRHTGIGRAAPSARSAATSSGGGEGDRSSERSTGRWTFAALFLLCLLGGGAPAPAAPQARAPAPAADQRARPEPREEAGKPQPQAAAQQPTRSGGKRRHNYAFCNRESHKRNLRGGARRRFLIRCKLGYEQRQPSRQTEPSAPGRRP